MSGRGQAGERARRGSRAHEGARSRRTFVRTLSLAVALALPGAAAAAPEAVDVLVMIVDFADAPAPALLQYEGGASPTVPLDVPNATSVFFTDAASTAARYADMSHGDLTLTGAVARVAIPLEIGSAAFLDWKAAADAEAAAQGYVLSDFDRLAYLVSYGFAGQMSTGNASGNGDWLWASSVSAASTSLNERVFAHELGHTLGLRHASEIQPDGSVLEFGDTTDFMGSGGAVHTNAPNKLRKGWLGGARHQAHPLDTASIWVLHGLADPADALQVVTIDAHGALASLGVPVDTHLSFRPPVGIDANLADLDDAYGTALRGTVHVHHDRKDGKLFRYLERALAAGDVFTSGGATIEVLSLAADTATVSVSQAAYYPNPPLVTVSPVATDQAYASTPLDYSVSITSTDDPSVGFPAFFENSFTLPGPGWIANWDVDPKEILVDTGATVVVQGLRITSPPAATPGVYAIGLTLTNTTGSAGPVSTTASASYEVLPSPDLTPPPAPTALFANTFPGSGNDYAVLQWTEPADVSDVMVYQPYRNGVALPTPLTRQALYVDFVYDGSQTNAYVVRSVDAAGNESLPSNAIVLGVPDLVAPAPPDGLGGVADPLAGTLTLDWNPATDDVFVYAYEVHRNGVLYATTFEPTFTDTALAPGTARYTVRAVDAAGNVSEPSAPWFYGARAVPALPPLALLAGALALCGAAALRSWRHS